MKRGFLLKSLVKDSGKPKRDSGKPKGDSGKPKGDSGNPKGEVGRNWAELPRDALSLIFQKVGVIDILRRAQWVCSAWRNFSKEPHLYRYIYTEKWEDSYHGGSYIDMEKLVREAIDRSCGQIIEITMDSFATDELLQYMAEKSGSLRSLRLVYSALVTCNGLLAMARKLPLLEELGFCYCFITKDMVEAVGNLCPRLKTFQLNYTTFTGSTPGFDEGALAIARSMHELRHLNLFGSRLTDVGLRAILDGCSHLQSLDLRRCCHVALAGDLKTRCAERNIKLQLPKDPTDDYIHDIYSTSEDEDSESGTYYEFGMGYGIYPPEPCESGTYYEFGMGYGIYPPAPYDDEDPDPYGLL